MPVSTAEERGEKFVRWQATRNEQLTAVNRLLIGLTTGVLAALLAVANEVVSEKPAQGAAIALLVLAGVVTLISLGSGLWLAVNRYHSFRMTAMVARIKRKEPAERTREEKSEIAWLECQYRQKDRRTLCLFRVQVWFFAAGAVALVVAEALDLWTRWLRG